jgi:hypothetical protein
MFGQNVAALADDVAHANNGFGALDQWMCDAPGGGPRCEMSMAGAPHRMLLLDPIVNGKRVHWGTVGVGFRRSSDGKSHWRASFASGECDVEASTEVFSATHMVAEKSTRFTAVYYPASDDVTLDEARVIVDGESYQLTKDFPRTASVRGNYAVDVAHADDGMACRAYWFEFASTTQTGEQRFSRYPEAGALMTTGELNGAKEDAVCEEGWDFEGMSLQKRAANNPLLADIDFTVTSTSRPENFLEGNDTSMNGRLADNSIAATEASRFSFRVENRGFRNQTEATIKGLAPEYQAVLSLVCTAPDSDAVLSNLALKASFANGTTMPLSGTTAGSGLVLTWTTPVLNKSESASLAFRVVTDANTPNGNIKCTATILTLRNSANNAVLEPELFDNGVNLNSTQTVIVERRTDIVVYISRSKTAVVAGGASPSNRIEIVVTALNKGPINATNVIVGLVAELAHDIVRSVAEQVSSGSVVASTPLVRTWTIGNLHVGEQVTLKESYDVLAGADEGEQGRVRAFLRSMTEQKIFILDDSYKTSINVNRALGLRLSHQLVVRTTLSNDLQERNDEVEFTLFVDNDGPSNSAGVTVELAFNTPKNVVLDHYESDGTGDLLPQQRMLIGKHGKKLLPEGDFYFWVAGKLDVGQRKRLKLIFKANRRHEGGSALQIGAAVVRKLTQEKTLLNDDDASLLVFQQL